MWRPRGWRYPIVAAPASRLGKNESTDSGFLSQIWSQLTQVNNLKIRADSF